MATLNQTVRPIPRVRKADRDTKAGNYFVSNYPPFSYWTDEHIPDYHAALERPPAEDTPLGMYIHIPFCRKRCHFCYFKVFTGMNAKQIQRYLDAVLAEMAMYDGKPFIGGRKPQFIYFGGGTPSFLSAKQLGQLTEGLQEALPWDEAEEITFECEPGTLNEKKLATIRRMGVTRLSLGVENFNDHVLKTNNRAHESEQVYKAYQWARNVGFPQINIDLIAGMLDETEANWMWNVEEAIRLAPDCVTIYQMEIPRNTTIYQQMRERGEITAPVADWDTKRRWAKYAFEQLEKAGYRVDSGYTAVKDSHYRFTYRDSLWTGADLLALGVSSFGHINDTHYQNEKDYQPYVERVESGELPIRRALPIDEDQQLLRQFVLQMKLGRVHLGYFREKFGVDLLDRFPEQIELYRSHGFLTVEDDQIILDRDALLQADTMIYEFLPREVETARYT